MNIAVVFVSYLEVPVQRLRDHFNWNAEAYRQFGNRLRVYVVTDVFHELPSCAECVIFPMEELPFIGGRRRFSITRTKNAGIRKAIEDGAEVVISTDVDMRFPSGSLEWLAAVRQDAARVPIYHMMDFSDHEHLLKVDNGCTGTTSMTADNWRRVQYDESLSEYGGDDGALLRDIGTAGLMIERECRIDHIGHMPGDGERVPGAGADTCWGRASGFNRNNIRGNKKTLRLRR
ncbi:hypothetical protein [Petrachloros mirabilis]